MTGTGQYDNLCRFLTQTVGLEEVLIDESELDGEKMLSYWNSYS